MESFGLLTDARLQIEWQTGLKVWCLSLRAWKKEHLCLSLFGEIQQCGNNLRAFCFDLLVQL